MANLLPLASVAGTVSELTSADALVLQTPSTPVTSNANTIGVFSSANLSRLLPAFIDPTGLVTLLQPNIARHRVGMWTAQGNSTTITSFGLATPTAVGTATARNYATTNIVTRTRKIGYVSAATAGSLSSIRVSAAQFSIGNSTTPAGGFTLVTRFGCSDAATVAGARQFVGMTSTTSAPTNVEPSTLTNCIGVGHGAADTNLKIFYGGSAAQTPIDLGANFPANTLSADMYEFTLYASPFLNTVDYKVERLGTAFVATGTLSGTAGTALPANTTALTNVLWRCNNATALAVGLDLSQLYIETKD